MTTAPPHYTLVEPATNDVATCRRKTRWGTKQRAKKGKALAERRDVKLYIYECSVCHGWHLTSSDPTVERERRSRKGSQA